jgi:O-antigen ligase
MNYRIFGESVPFPIVVGALVLLGFCLLALKLRTVLFLTIVVLFLPSLDMRHIAGLGRILRWAFLFGLVGKGLATNLRRGFRPHPNTRVHRTILFLSVLIGVSMFWSIGPGMTIRQGLMMVVLWVGIFLVLWNSWETEKDILVVCNTLFWFACLLFSLELVYVTFGLGRSSGIRYSGVFLNPNGLGTAAAFLGPFVYWKFRSTEAGPLKLWSAVLGLIMAVSLVNSGSRSGMLGALVCMGVMVTHAYRAKAAVLAGIVAIPLSILLILSPKLDPTVLDDTRFIRTKSLATFSDRLPMWEKGFDKFLERPIYGYGYGMSKFAEFGRANVALELSLLRTRGMNYHNAHLQVALDFGLLGLLAFWIYIFLVLKSGLAVYRSPRRSPLEVGGIAFYAAFIALVGDTFVHGWAFSPGSSMSIVFWLVAACVVRIQLFTTEAVAEEAKSGEAAEWRGVVGVQA